MVCEKRDSTVDWEAVPDRVLQRRTAETGRLRTRRVGERGSCKFPENTKLFWVFQQKCKKFQPRNFENSEDRNLQKAVIQSLPLYHPDKGENSEIRAHVTVAECREEPLLLLIGGVSPQLQLVDSLLWVLRVLPENQGLPVISFGHDETRHPVFTLKNMICYLGHIKNGRLWPEDLLPRSDSQFGTRSNGQR